MTNKLPEALGRPLNSKEAALPAPLARQLLQYNELTGEFFRRTSSRWFKAGDKAGYLDSEGYVLVRIDNVMYRGHRLAWLMYYGEWPKENIDHLNGVRSDNRISNLRAVTMAANSQNVRGLRKSQSGLRGVSKDGNGWKAAIKANGVRHYLGTFSTKEAAYAAYVKARKELHPGASEELIADLESKVVCPYERLNAATKLLEQARDALAYHVEQTRPIHRTAETLAALNQHLEPK